MREHLVGVQMDATQRGSLFVCCLVSKQIYSFRVNQMWVLEAVAPALMKYVYG